MENLSEHCMLVDMSAQLSYINQDKYYLYKYLEISIGWRQLMGMASHSTENCFAFIVLSWLQKQENKQTIKLRESQDSLQELSELF